MKEKMKLYSHMRLIASGLLCLLFSFVGVSCSDDTTDDTAFQLFYSDVTDIGPSMNMRLYEPTYIGPKPSDFSIIGVKLDDNKVEAASFDIEPETGAILIENTSELAIGTYSLSVACKAGGKNYSFQDIVRINMMRTVPDGILASPDKIEVSYEDVQNKNETELPSSQITTDGEHIHINKYVIANVKYEGELIPNEELFTVSSKGVVTFGSKRTDLKPGKYVLDMKLTTAVVDEESEEGLFANAIEFNITSKPLSLTFDPDRSKAEFNAPEAVKSVVPEMVGSREDLKYEIIQITPADAPITIDPATGELSLGTNSLSIGTECKVSVKVTNRYGTSNFDNAYTFEIVPLIHPITKFAYPTSVELIEATAMSQKVETIDGDEVTYSFKDLPANLEDELTINPQTGEISTEKGNRIPHGKYTINVVAENTKGSKTATFSLNVVENKYLFTYVHWGNNLNLTPARNYASQYRITQEGTLTMKVSESDIKDGVEALYSIDTNNSSVSEVTIDEKTGEITFNKWQAGKAFVIMVTTTTGKGTSAEVTVKTPVFVHCSAPVKGVTVDYTPFVFQVNPRTGGTSVAPTVTGAEPDKLLMDYRRNFWYYNIGGPDSHESGQLNKGNTSTFIYKMWQNYYGEAAVNAGARKPVSYYDNKASLNNALCYVNATKGCAVTVNPGKWQMDQEYANGVFIGQITFTADGNEKNVASGGQIFPVVIWFNTDF
jgi:hypothetical protein